MRPNPERNIDLPGALKEQIHDAELVEVHEGMSGVRVFRVDEGHYLKIAERHSEQDLYPEVTRLLWLQHRLPVPQIAYWGEDARHQYLLMTAVPGVVLYDESVRERLADVIRLYASGLRQIHGLTVEPCPFDARLDLKIAQAEGRLRAGGVDVSNFDSDRAGWSADEAFEHLLETRPSDEDLVFTHGDYCTPNVLIDPVSMSMSGFIDWGRAGIADRYQDLALAARSIEYNFGAAWVTPFFEAYGITRVDQTKVAFYKLLDEFF